MADHKSNMNEFSSKAKSPILPKIRTSLDFPLTNFQSSQALNVPKKTETSKKRTFGSQSERVYTQISQVIKKPHPTKLLKLPFKEPPSALSMSNQFLTSPKENIEFPEFVMSLPE